MSDLIDRQSAIDEILRLTSYDTVRSLYEATVADKYDDYEGGIMDAIDAVIGVLAQPEQQWIPVTERLPEVDENVLVSYHFDGDSEFFPPFDGVTISYWTGVKNHNIPHFADMGDACTILAWMPLPEPYREEDNG